MDKSIDIRQIEEEKLLKRYLSGDNTAFGPLYERYKSIYFYHVNKQLPFLPMEEKEDLSIDFLGRISGNLHKYDKEKSLFRTWMTRCMLYHLNQYRNKKSTREKYLTEYISKENRDNEIYDITIVSDENPLEKVSYLNIIKLIKGMLGELDWKIFELHFLQGHSQSETGKRLDLRPDTMWYKIKQIRKKLDGIENL
jgi:RNA polymerase sigma factor (sigma-70 family)